MANRVNRKDSINIFKRFLLALCIFLAILIILEFTIRVYSLMMGKGFWRRPHTFTSAFFVTYDWPPPLIEGTKGTFRAGQVVDMRKPAKEFRVICLGGSTTVNDRNSKGLVYSREIQKILKGKISGYEVKVLNAGADAFSTAHSLTNFSLRLLSFNPDIIILNHNINDLSVLEFGENVLPDYSNKYLDDFYLSYEHRQGIGGAILRSSRLLQVLTWRIAILRKILEKTSKNKKVKNPELGKQIFVRNLESIAAIAKHHGVDVILITQPHRDGENGIFAEYNDAIREVAKRNSVELVDASKLMSNRGELFLDEVHFSSQGVRTIAKILAPVVEERLRMIAKKEKNIW